MLKPLLILAFFLLTPFSICAQQQRAYAMPQTQVIPIKDSKSNRQYELYVKLPESYFREEAKEKHYPVIYFTDAVWHIDILSAATSYLMEDVILVGVSWQLNINDQLKRNESAHFSRYRDYSISKSTKPARQEKYQFGQAGKHLEFIQVDVFDKVENQYRTQPNNRTYFSYSLGAQLGIYALLVKPELFKNYILGSPAISNPSQLLTNLVNKHNKEKKASNLNVFISYGNQEEQLGERAERLIVQLKGNEKINLNLTKKIIEGSHQSAFPTTGVTSIKWLAELAQN